MDAPFEEGEGHSLVDVLQDNNSATTDSNMSYSDSLKIDTERMLSRLKDIEKQVIKMYFGIGGQTEALQLEAIAEELNLTKERIRQIKERAIKRLQKARYSNALKAYLG